MEVGEHLQDYNESPLVPGDLAINNLGFQEPYTPPASASNEQAISEDDFDAARINSLLDLLKEPQQNGQDIMPAPATDEGYQFVNPMDLVNGPQLQPHPALQGGLLGQPLPQFLPLAAQGQHIGASPPAPQPLAFTVPQPLAFAVPQPQQATQGGLSDATETQAGAGFRPLPTLVKLATGKYSCSDCPNKAFRTRQLVESHIKGVHGEAAGLPLLQCGKCHRGITRDPANMRRHERDCHGRAVKYHCHKCGRESTSKYNMNRHIVTCRHAQPAQQ